MTWYTTSLFEWIDTLIIFVRRKERDFFVFYSTTNLLGGFSHRLIFEMYDLIRNSPFLPR